MFRTTNTAQHAKPEQSAAALLQSAIKLQRAGNLNEARRRYRQIERVAARLANLLGGGSRLSETAAACDSF